MSIEKVRHMTLLRLEGLIPYAEGHSLQLRLREERKAGDREDTLVLLEHAPVITLGRNSPESGVTATRTELKELNIEVHRVERGGKATYHGPGQLVGYPILELRGLGIRGYVSKLEEVLLLTLAEFGLTGFRVEGKHGVFCKEGKIGAIGVSVSSGVTMHGFSLNLDPEMEYFDLITPCGLKDVDAVSMAGLLGEPLAIDDIAVVAARIFGEVFNVRWSG